MEASSSDGGLIPEQIWDAKDIPARELFLGRPAGSAMPLAWAHAEHVKLLRSLHDGAVFDMPPQPTERYIRNKSEPSVQSWRINAQVEMVNQGRDLRIELLEPAIVRWSSNSWRTFHDAKAEASEFGTYLCNLPTKGSPGNIIFTIYWADRDSWEGKNFFIQIRKVRVCSG